MHGWLTNKLTIQNSPLDMNVRSKFKLSHAASNFVKYSFLWSPWPNFNAVKSGMVRVAKTSLFLYKFKVTPLAAVWCNNPSHKVSTTKIYCEYCIIAAIAAFIDCTFLLIISRQSLARCFDFEYKFFFYFFFICYFVIYLWNFTLRRFSVFSVESIQVGLFKWKWFQPFDMPDQSYLKCGLATTWSFMSVVLMRWLCLCCAKAENKKLFS